MQSSQLCIAIGYLTVALVNFVLLWQLLLLHLQYYTIITTFWTPKLSSYTLHTPFPPSILRWLVIFKVFIRFTILYYIITSVCNLTILLLPRSYYHGRVSIRKIEKVCSTILYLTIIFTSLIITISLTYYKTITYSVAILVFH